MSDPQRIEKLLKFDELRASDGVLITNAFNRRYLSGFHGTAGMLIATRDQLILATDSRYTEQATIEAPNWEVRDTTNRGEWLAELVSELGITNLAFEADDITHHSHTKLQKQFADKNVNVELTPTTKLVARLRNVKDADELAQLERAVQIGDLAFTKTAEAIQIGQTEREVAFMFEFNARELGAEALSFPTILAAGANAAKPHHKPSDSKIKAGETIVFDCGVLYEGYCSDLTRTLVLGEPDAKIVEVYNVVLEAQKRGTDAIKAGLLGREVDAVARQHIKDAGYGDYFGHGLGHGVGLEVHEEPYLAPRGEAPLEVGAVVTVEPGIYIPNWGGVRIEDMVVVEQSGARVLSQAPKLSFK